MPRHHQATCRKGGGSPSKLCTCEHWAPAVCGVCGGSEGALTTDCPGVLVDPARQQEIAETQLDYTDARGWHLIGAMEIRSPRFGHMKVPTEPREDPRGIVAPSVDWARVDRNAQCQHELALKAIAWVIAERSAEDRSAICTRLEDEVDGRDPSQQTQELRDSLKIATADFLLANQRAEKCDDEFRQAARRLVEALEQGSLAK